MSGGATRVELPLFLSSLKMIPTAIAHAVYARFWCTRLARNRITTFFCQILAYSAG